MGIGGIYIRAVTRTGVFCCYKYKVTAGCMYARFYLVLVKRNKQ